MSVIPTRKIWLKINGQLDLILPIPMRILAEMLVNSLEPEMLGLAAPIKELAGASREAPASVAVSGPGVR